MRFHRISRVVIAGLACMIVAGLVVIAGHSVKAQGHRDAFIDLLRPYVSKEIEISPMVGARVEPIILKEIGPDYILIEAPQGLTRAVSIYSITSLTFGEERLQIHMGGY
jgi:hypothetical protein